MARGKAPQRLAYVIASMAPDAWAPEAVIAAVEAATVAGLAIVADPEVGALLSAHDHVAHTLPAPAGVTVAASLGKWTASHGWAADDDETRHGAGPSALICALPVPAPAAGRALRDALARAQLLRQSLANGAVTVLVDAVDTATFVLALADHDPERAEALRLKAVNHLAAFDRSLQRAQGAEPEPPTGLVLAPWPVTARRRLERVHDTSGWMTRVQPIQPLCGPTPDAHGLLTLDAALSLIRWKPGVTAAALAHGGRPCSLAVSLTGTSRALLRALGSDPLGADGGTLACSAPLDLTTVRALLQHPMAGKIAALAAPDVEPEALALLQERDDLLVLRMPDIAAHGPARQLRSTAFGVFVRDAQRHVDPALGALQRTDGGGAPEEPWAGMLAIAMHVCGQLPGHATVVADGDGTLALCAGQTHALDAAQVAAAKARRAARPCAAVIDGPLTHPQVVAALARAQVKALAHRGVERDEAAILAAAGEAGMALFTLPDTWATDLL